MKMVFGLRMEAAEDMLLNSALSIKEVATRVGYEEWFNFSTAFKRCNGMSPTQFRETAHRRFTAG
jgi:AraC-like DNA-binding protein